MKINENSSKDIDKSQKFAAKVAGFMFLFILVDVIINWIIFSKFIVKGNAIATTNKILINEFLFRIGIANELILSISAIILALALYVTLKQVKKNLSLFALLFKVTEGIIMAGIALLNFIFLLILTNKAQLAIFPLEQLQTLAGFIFNIHDIIYAVPMIFLGLNLTLFSYLFYKSGYIPKWLAGFGVFSYVLVFIFAFANILAPNFDGMTLVLPSILFELLIGIWLLFKGIHKKIII